MNAEDKQDILDFIDFYVVLGIVHQKTLCKYLGISVRTIQRWRKNGTADKRKGSERKIPRKLTPEERRRIYQELCSPEYKDLNPNEIYNSLLDKGIYLASSRTFYRILKEFNAIYHRTEERKGNSKKKPDELKATAANQVWMWDITWLKTDVRGIYYYAYVIEDLYDRSIVGWMIFDSESDVHAAELFDATCRKENCHPDFVHSDNGEPMKGITLCAFYYQLGIIPSFSRPRVSDDNPYIESFFKTTKYQAGYPKCFHSLKESREWFSNFIHWYNYEHKHSNLQYVTPMEKRKGKHIGIFENRNSVLEKAKLNHPERWGSRNTKQYEVRKVEVLNPDERKSA